MAVKRVKKTSNTEDLLTCIVDAIQEKKGKNVVSLEIGALPNAVCKYFVFCNADSTTQVDAIANNIEDKVLEKLGEKVYRSDGYQNAIWIVLDYIDIVVHVFQTEWRNYYRVEALWADAKAIQYEEV
ncbi:ribosome silencing factor [Tenuifilum osseticum]|uniref:ribosome silencing factor n=1 Tax=Tenuifilum TaxID=2760873 RepID=UPI001B640BEC|nr:ribosome silencing factor [Bacteroidales bacterium]HOK60712.1 ribosome silencing factor [Tenuifilum sp.]MBP9029716.1 ribosome silencing factor [Bacteroidales bacterium]HOK85333.1 ribosome silencing factor [Tenuifilum sp.]HON70876.1 ribosome silencing factor [Tenuifilum sp.]